MKNFSQFIKEEIDLRGNAGIPDDFMRNSDRQAERNLGVRIDQPQQMMQLGPRIGQLLQETNQIMLGRLNPQQLEDRWVRLEELAHAIILDEFNEILEASDKPVELLIKLLRPWLRQTVNNQIPDMDDCDACNPPAARQEVTRDPELKKSVDKKKLLNALNQGYAKSTKDIIQASPRVQPALREIFGNDADRIYRLWLEITEVANKMDWVIPIEAKAHMMKDQPQGMAGACQVKWEKEEDEEEKEIKPTEYKPGSDDNDDDGQAQEEQDFTKIVIKAVGVDFPMLLHEAVKGIFQLLQSGAIKDDEELAKFIAQNTESFEDESQDFRYGPVAQKMFRFFVLSCRDCDRYSNMDARIYAKLALDKDRGGDLTDEEFLEVTKDIFSCFDLLGGGNLEFELNMDRFGQSSAKTKIERMISDIIAAEREYEAELSKWEMENQFSKNIDQDDNVSDEDEDEFKSYLSDMGISSAKDKQEVEDKKSDIEDSDLKDSDGKVISQSKLRDLIDDALDAGDYEEARRIGKYIKEGKQIYLREADRIEEYKKYRRN